MSVSSPYVDSGRREQKQRTRTALVEAARALVASGVTPTVEAAAARAAVSRTTAYRYFTNQRELLVAAHPETGASSLLPTPAPDDVETRLADVVARFTDLIVETEPQQRTMLRLSLEMTAEERAGLPLRQGRAIGWIGEALQPLGDVLTDQELHRLALAVRSVSGIEALTWLTDVAALPRDQAVALMRWSAQAMLRAATSGSPPPRPRRRRSARE